MGLILEKKENISQIKFNYTFEVKENGIYVLLVSARAKSWFQNLIKFISFFKDDNLAVKINGNGFPKLFGKEGDFDGEAAWNGNKLKGLKQINLFVVYLEKGKQNLEFLAKGSPVLELIEVYRVDKNKIFIDPSKYGIEEGNRRPWFKLLTQNVGVVSVSANAITDLKSEDDNDLQIRINGTREQNHADKAHKYWYWCGRVLKGQSKTFERTVNLKPGFNYIEFWADGAPLFNELNVRVTLSDRIPTVDDPAWTGDFYDDSEEIILARLIFGEARGQSEEAKIWAASTVLNRIKGWWPDTIHEVILQDQQYRSFNQDDPNRSIVENPLHDLTQKQSWLDSYRVAEGILNGNISVPSETTHFHDTRQSQEDFMRLIPDGKFLKKIGNLYFYWSPR